MAMRTILTKVGLEPTHQTTTVAQNITQTNTTTKMELAGNQQLRQQLTQGELAYTKSSCTIT